MPHHWGRFLLPLLLAGALSAQSGQSSPSDQTDPQKSPAASQQGVAGSDLVLKITTRMVVVDVVVHDKKDQVVRDLEAADFTLREDGVEQKISAFSLQRPAEGAPAPPPAPGVMPSNVFRNVPHFRAKSALNVVLLDGLNTTLLNQAYVRVEMVKFLEKLPQGQPIAIYALGRRLRLLQDFTTDLSELKSVIQSFKGQSSHVLSNAAGTSEVPMTLQGWAEQTAAEKAPLFKSQIEGFAAETASNQTDTQIQFTMAALSSLARMLAGYPGRKNLIWITEGIPMNIFNEGSVSMASAQTADGGGPTRSLGNPASQQRSARTYSDQLALLNNLLADAQVAVYPVDARGLVGPAMSNVANNVSGQGAMGGLASRVEGAQAELLFQAHSNMRDIAEKTGGKAFFNRNDLDNAVRGDMEDGSVYYSLGYYPENKDWNGRFRKIQVTAKRSGVKLRYRVGYFAVDHGLYLKNHPQQRAVELDLALNPDAPLATSLQFTVAVVPPTQSERKVLLNYALDPHDLSFAHGADGLEHADLDCAARVFAPSKVDKPVKSEAIRVATALKPEVYKTISGSYFPCQLPLELPPGNYLLRLAVRDNTTGLLGSVNAQVVVPAVSPAAEPKPAENSHQP
ncbi:MAG TPA: VWA domain-containing protein [Candidatus Angelobacter sp.]|nr:VWA domain-containing protein [Candidatus Angelobacter sp.]